LQINTPKKSLVKDGQATLSFHISITPFTNQEEGKEAAAESKLIESNKEFLDALKSDKLVTVLFTNNRRSSTASDRILYEESMKALDKLFIQEYEELASEMEHKADFLKVNITKNHETKDYCSINGELMPVI